MKAVSDERLAAMCDSYVEKKETSDARRTAAQQKAMVKLQKKVAVHLHKVNKQQKRDTKKQAQLAQKSLQKGKQKTPTKAKKGPQLKRARMPLVLVHNESIGTTTDYFDHIANTIEYFKKLNPNLTPLYVAFEQIALFMGASGPSGVETHAECSHCNARVS